jgi:hypothetical protein
MTRQIYTLLLITLFSSCGQSHKGKGAIAPGSQTNLNGYWILTNYVDEVLATRSIEPPSRRLGLASAALVLKIDHDSIQTQGLMWAFKYPVSGNLDSLATVEANYKLAYNKQEGTIHAYNLGGEDTVHYIFRKAGREDQRLVAHLEERPPFEQLEKNFYSFFIDKLIAGTYQPLIKTGDLNTLKLLPGGTTTGFKQFDTYSIHDYFYSLHPYTNDAIIFIDTNKVVREDQLPDNYEAYKWEFRKDTLVLTEYITEDLETFRPGTKQYKLLKEKATSH